MRVLACCVFLATLVFAGERKIVDLEKISRPVDATKASTQAVMVRVSRQAKTSTASRATAGTVEPIAADKLVQAPGVVQIDQLGDYLNNGMTVWFVTTALIPKGSTVSAYVIIEEADGYEAYTKFQSRTLDDDIPAGYSFFLPSIHRFSGFWVTGTVMTYGVKVTTVDGAVSYSIDDFRVKANRMAVDLPLIVPLVKQSSQSWTDDGRPIMTLDGVFTDSTPTIVLDDVVVPPEAIVSADRSRIMVDLSKTGIDPTSLWTAVLTVGQDGFANTSAFRFCPRF